jgi:hypothetical protein
MKPLPSGLAAEMVPATRTAPTAQPQLRVRRCVRMWVAGIPDRWNGRPEKEKRPIGYPPQAQL